MLSLVTWLFCWTFKLQHATKLLWWSHRTPVEAATRCEWDWWGTLNLSFILLKCFYTLNLFRGIAVGRPHSPKCADVIVGSSFELFTRMTSITADLWVWTQTWELFVWRGACPKSLFKSPPFNLLYFSLRCYCFHAQKCGCCNYHLHKQDSSFIDMQPLIRRELGSETMAEATRGSPAPGTRDCPASSINVEDQQKLPVIHRTLTFLINFHSARLWVLVWGCWPPRST